VRIYKQKYAYTDSMPGDTAVPNKTIYVSDEDGPLFRRAQNIAGGNLSAAIARTVRRFVETEESRMAGFEDFTVRVGTPGERRAKRFKGRPVAHWSHEDSQGRGETYTVYRTEGGRYAVHQEQGSPWQTQSEPWRWMQQFTGMRWPGAHGHHHGPQSPWHGGGWERFACAGMPHGSDRSGESTLRVFDTLSELGAAVPAPVLQQVEENESEPPVDDLDI